MTPQIQLQRRKLRSQKFSQYLYRAPKPSVYVLFSWYNVFLEALNLFHFLKPGRATNHHMAIPTLTTWKLNLIELRTYLSNQKKWIKLIFRLPTQVGIQQKLIKLIFRFIFVFVAVVHVFLMSHVSCGYTLLFLSLSLSLSLMHSANALVHYFSLSLSLWHRACLIRTLLYSVYLSLT